MCSIKNGKEKLISGEYKAALVEAAALLSTNTRDFQAWYVTACAAFALGDEDAAVGHLRSLADALADFGQPLFAIQVIKAAAARGGDVTDNLSHLAELYSRGSKRTAEMAIVPPPLPAAGAAPPWEIDSDEETLVAEANRVMTEAWGDLFAFEGTVEALPFVPILSNLSPEDFVMFVDALSLVTCPPGRVVVEQGAKGDGFFIIIEGEVAVVRRSPECEPKRLAKLGPGAFFGEMALVSNARRAAEVRAVEHTVLLRASKLQLEALSARAPEIGRVLIAFCHVRMLENLIRVSPVLSPVPPQKRPALIGAFTTDYRTAGEVIMAEGEEGEGLYLVVSGQVTVTRQEDGETMLLATLGPGDLFGEISLLMQKPSTATVTARENTALLFLSAEEFMGVTASYPEFLKGVFDIALKRERENNSVLAGEIRNVDECILL